MKITPGSIRISILVVACLAVAVGCKYEPPNDVVYEKPKETISLEEAGRMYKSYQKRAEALKATIGKEDAQYGWHSIDFYKNYIGFLEQEAKKVNMKVSGLRTYYVAYPDDSVKYPEKHDYQTYILVPTYYDEKTGTNIAFDPLHVKDGVPMPIHEVITTGRAKAYTEAMFRFASTTSETPSSVANMAEMCKPNCRN